MVEMMQGVTRGGGTASSASAGGHPLAGKTGTVNDHTDVWFIGYTPTYVTGIWMGNPLRKSSLGSGMTGGHGAVPYFNAFMVPFMKDKPRDSFSKPPPMPADIKELSEARKREEVEKLEKADAAGKSLGISFNTGTRRRSSSSSGVSIAPTNTSGGIVPTKTDDGGTPPTFPTNSGGETTKPPVTSKTPENPKKPDVPTVKETPKPDQPKKKGKKGDDEP
jgi:penicillin-binding protein 1A